MIIGLITFITIFSLVYGITGVLLIKHPPKDINSVIGYRTKKSSLNQKTWDFAQNYSGKLFRNMGIINFIFCMMIILIFANNQNAKLFFLPVGYCQVAEIFLIIILTEVKLKKFIKEMK